MMKLLIVIIFFSLDFGCPITTKKVIEKGCDYPSNSSIPCYIKFTDSSTCLVDPIVYRNINIRDSIKVQLCNGTQYFYSK